MAPKSDIARFRTNLQEEIDAAAHAAKRGVLAVGNFALTAVLLQKFSEMAAKYIPHWEIIGLRPFRQAGCAQRGGAAAGAFGAAVGRSHAGDLGVRRAGGFIEAPLRTYSSGMVARLGFAVATAWWPEFLIGDDPRSMCFSFEDGLVCGTPVFNAERAGFDQMLMDEARRAGAEIRAISAVDVALWDLLGKIAWLPLYVLLGGKCREDVPVYNTCYDDQYDFNSHPAELARDLWNSGIRAMKVWPFDRVARKNRGQTISIDEMRESMEPIRRIREALGEKMDIAVEFHGFWNLPCAVKIAQELDWQPRISLTEGLKRAVEWYRTNTQWVESVRDGEYRDYYKKYYEERDSTLQADLSL